MNSEGEVCYAAATVDISPTVPTPLAGFSNRRGPFRKVGSPIEANLLQIRTGCDTVVIIQLDALFPSRDLQRAILERSKCGLAPDNLILVASHTHNAPALDPSKPKLGVVHEGHFISVAERLAEAVRDLASRRGRPAKIRYGQVDAALNVSRRALHWHFRETFPFLRHGITLQPNLTIDVDNRLEVLSFDAGLEVIAVVWRWTCHPVENGSIHELSANFPGAVRERLRQEIRQDLPVVFLQGFAGDVNPRHVSRYASWRDKLFFPCGPWFARLTPAERDAWRRTLAAELLDALESALPLEVGPSVEHTRVDADLADFLTHPPPHGSLPVLRLSIGSGLHFVFVGAEVCQSYTSQVRSRLSGIVMPVGYFDEVFGYLPSDAQVREGGYEAGDFMPYFSLRGKLKRNLEFPFLSSLDKVCLD